MIPAHLTLDAITRHVHKQAGGPRRHLGASVIGEECVRAVFYKYRWTAKSSFNARMLRLFQRGHREEPSLLGWLRGAGLTCYAAGESGELKEQLRISDHNGHFGGTPDGVATGCPDLPDEPCLLEFKTHSDKAFQAMKKDGVFVENRKYYVQMQIYMHKLELKWGLYVGVNKNDDELYLQLVEYNAGVALHYLKLAGEIIYARELPPRISDTPGHWKCRFCDFKETCHFDRTPESNCRTCRFAQPAKESNPQGMWVCQKGRWEVDTQPEKGCGHYELNKMFFKPDVPF